MTRHIVASKKQDWGTPRPLFEGLHAEFGFTVDLAASAYNAKLPRFYDEAYDTLRAGPLAAPERGWCNPPYDNIEDWLRWAVWSCGFGGFSVWLVPANTDTGWFHRYAKLGQIDFFEGRINFVDETPPIIELPRLHAVALRTPKPGNDLKLAACAFRAFTANSQEAMASAEWHAARAYLEGTLGPRWYIQGERESEKRAAGSSFPSMLVIFDPEKQAGPHAPRSRCPKTGRLL